jgi:hypothetical protein
MVHRVKGLAKVTEYSIAMMCSFVRHGVREQKQEMKSRVRFPKTKLKVRNCIMLV